jgi:NTF2-related export protein 1/2
LTTNTFSSATSIDIASRAADQFTRLYYKAYDSPNRVDDLPKFYRSSSTLTWNGKPYQGVAGVKELIENMPPTRHEVQSYDCHTIPGTYIRVSSDRLSFTNG